MTDLEIQQKLAQNKAALSTAGAAQRALLNSENAYLQAQLTANEKSSLYQNKRSEVENSKYAGYDAESDPAYQAVRKRYLQEADRGTEDVLGAYAGQTGGYASTAAIAAAQQQGNYYRSQLTDKELELGNQDYQKYQDDLAAKQAMLAYYQNDAETAGNNAYTLGSEYNEYKNQLAANSAAQLAALGDFSEMAALYGWTDAQLAAANAAWADSQATGSGSGGSGRGSGSGSDMTYSEIADALTPMLTGNKVGDWDKILTSNELGLNSTEMKTAKEIVQGVKQQVVTSIASDTTKKATTTAKNAMTAVKNSLTKAVTSTLSKKDQTQQKRADRT